MFLRVVASVLAVFLAVGNATILAGGMMDADISDPSVQKALDFAVAEHNKASNDLYLSQVSKVIRVQKQVVAGMKYVFIVEITRTSCRKGGVEEVCTVPTVSTLAQPKECKIVVWDRPWLQAIKVLENTCIQGS